MGRRTLVRREAAIADTMSSLALAADYSLGNFWSITGASPSNMVGATPGVIGVILITPKQSGIFRFNVDAGYSDNTNADLVAWRLRVSQVNVAGQTATLTNSTASGFGGTTAGGVSTGGAISSTTAGITITAPAGGASAAKTVDTKTIESLNGLLTGSSQLYSAHGITNGASGAFALGRQVVFFVDVNSANTILTQQLSFAVEELPWV